MTKRIDALVQDICAGAHPLLADWLGQTCGRSRPFLAFAEAHASKIRKKVRLLGTEEDRQDLLAELAVAACFLQDPRFAVLYESRRAPGQRSPDLEVVFRTHTSLLVEVTRMRLAGDSERLERRAARLLADKISQFPAGIINLLVVVLPPGTANDTLIPAALRMLDGVSGREGSEGGALLRLERVKAFQRARQRLSGVALWSFTPEWQPEQVKVWVNPQARHACPPEIVRFLVK